MQAVINKFGQSMRLLLPKVPKSVRLNRLYELLSKSKNFAATHHDEGGGAMINFYIGNHEPGSFFNHYMVRIDNEEQTFYELILPYFWRWEGQAPTAAILRACNSANVTSKFCKVYFWDDAVYCSVHAQAASEKDFVDQIDRYISAAKYGADIFLKNLDNEFQVEPR